MIWIWIPWIGDCSPWIKLIVDCPPWIELIVGCSPWIELIVDYSPWIVLVDPKRLASSHSFVSFLIRAVPPHSPDLNADRSPYDDRSYRAVVCDMLPIRLRIVDASRALYCDDYDVCADRDAVPSPFVVVVVVVALQRHRSFCTPTRPCAVPAVAFSCVFPQNYLMTRMNHHHRCHHPNCYCYCHHRYWRSCYHHHRRRWNSR